MTKMERLAQWCKDINKIESQTKYHWLYIEQDKFEKYSPSDFSVLINLFIEDKNF